MARNPFYVDRQSYPSQPLRPNYEADQYVEKDVNGPCWKKRVHPGNGINRALRHATPLKTGSRSELCKKTPGNPQYRLLQIRVRSRGPSPLYIEERHRALGRDATFSWSRALTHPPRCNRTRHRGRHLDFVGAAILDLTSWGPPSWTGSDVKNAKPAPILLTTTNNKNYTYIFWYKHLGCRLKSKRW